MRARNLQLVHQASDIGAEHREVVGRLGGLACTVPARIETHHAVTWVQRRRQLVPDGEIGGERMVQDHGRARIGPLDCEVHAKAIDGRLHGPSSQMYQAFIGSAVGRKSAVATCEIGHSAIASSSFPATADARLPTAALLPSQRVPADPSAGGAFCLPPGGGALRRSDKASSTLDTTNTMWMPAYHHSSRSDADLTAMNCFRSWIAEIATIEPSSLIFRAVKSIEPIHSGQVRSAGWPILETKFS